MATTRRDFLKRAAVTSAGMTALAVGADWQRASAASSWITGVTIDISGGKVV